MSEVQEEQAARLRRFAQPPSPATGSQDSLRHLRRLSQRSNASDTRSLLDGIFSPNTSGSLAPSGTLNAGHPGTMSFEGTQHHRSTSRAMSLEPGSQLYSSDSSLRVNIEGKMTELLESEKRVAIHQASSELQKKEAEIVRLRRAVMTLTEEQRKADDLKFQNEVLRATVADVTNELQSERDKRIQSDKELRRALEMLKETTDEETRQQNLQQVVASLRSENEVLQNQLKVQVEASQASRQNATDSLTRLESDLGVEVEKHKQLSNTLDSATAEISTLKKLLEAERDRNAQRAKVEADWEEAKVSILEAKAKIERELAQVSRNKDEARTKVLAELEETRAKLQASEAERLGLRDRMEHVNTLLETAAESTKAKEDERREKLRATRLSLRETLAKLTATEQEKEVLTSKIESLKEKKDTYKQQLMNATREVETSLDTIKAQHNVELERVKREHTQQVQELMIQLQNDREECRSIKEQVRLQSMKSSQASEEATSRAAVEVQRASAEAESLKQALNAAEEQTRRSTQKLRQFQATLDSERDKEKQLRSANADLQEQLIEVKSQTRRSQNHVQATVASMEGQISELEGLLFSLESLTENAALVHTSELLNYLRRRISGDKTTLPAILGSFEAATRDLISVVQNQKAFEAAESARKMQAEEQKKLIEVNQKLVTAEHSVQQLTQRVHESEGRIQTLMTDHATERSHLSEGSQKRIDALMADHAKERAQFIEDTQREIADSREKLSQALRRAERAEMRAREESARSGMLEARMRESDDKRSLLKKEGSARIVRNLSVLKAKSLSLRDSLGSMKASLQAEISQMQLLCGKFMHEIVFQHTVTIGRLDQKWAVDMGSRQREWDHAHRQLQTSIRNHQQTEIDLKDQLGNLELEIAEERSKTLRLKKTVEEQQDCRMRAEQSLKEAREQIEDEKASHHKAFHKATRELESLQNKHSESSERMVDLELQHDNLKDEHEAQSNLVEKLREQLHEVTRERQAEKQRGSSLEDDYDKVVLSLQAKTKELEEAKKFQDQLLQRLDSQVSSTRSLEEELGAATQREKELRDQCKSQHEQEMERDSAAAATRKKLTDSERQIVDLKTKVLDLEDQLRALHEREHKLNQSFQSSVKSETDLRKEFGKAIDLHKAQEDVHTSKAKDDEELIRRLKGKESTQELEVENLRRINHDLQEQADDLDCKLKELREREARLIAEVAEVKQLLQESEAREKRLKLEKNAEAKLQRGFGVEAVREREEAQSRLKGKEAKEKEMQQEIERLRESEEKLRSQLSSAISRAEKQKGIGKEADNILQSQLDQAIVCLRKERDRIKELEGQIKDLEQRSQDARNAEVKVEALLEAAKIRESVAREEALQARQQLLTTSVRAGMEANELKNVLSALEDLESRDHQMQRVVQHVQGEFSTLEEGLASRLSSAISEIDALKEENQDLKIQLTERDDCNGRILDSVDLGEPIQVEDSRAQKLELSSASARSRSRDTSSAEIEHAVKPYKEELQSVKLLVTKLQGQYHSEMRQKQAEIDDLKKDLKAVKSAKT